MPQTDYVRWLRTRVGHSKVILVYGSALVLDEQGHVLLQRRSDFAWWGLPGGVVERGETLAECVLREVREETGLQVQIERLIGVYSSPDFDVTYPNGDLVQQFTACFECRVSGGIRRPDGDEVLELESYPLDGLPDVPPWYMAMIEDQASGAVEASFGRGQAGRPTSEAHYLWLRRFVGHEPVTMVGASACVRDEAGQVLLVRRADDGTWSLPAGAMELGERIDRTVEREILEETGLRVEPERLVGIYSGPGFFHTYPNGDQVHIVTNLFTCRIAGGTLQPDGEEIVEARFFPSDQLPPLAARHQVRITDALADREGAVWT